MLENHAEWTNRSAQPIRTANLRPNLWADKLAVRAWRTRIEALYSQLAAMGVQRLPARSTPGLQLKLHASLLAVTITNADSQSPL